MSPELLRQMQVAAVNIGFPDWEVRDSDIILFNAFYDKGYYYSEYTNGNPSWTVELSVRRIDTEDAALGFRYNDDYWVCREFTDEDATTFVHKLLNGDI